MRSVLRLLLPEELPTREAVADLCARHLALVLAANEHVNLTGITDPLEAAVKHVYDSVAPWRLFKESRDLVDLGSGAGYPGIPLACVFPDRPVVLVESIRKKAAFLEEAVSRLGLENVTVEPRRAEELLRARPCDTVVARAVGPLDKLLRVLRPAGRGFRRLVLYKGPGAEREIDEAREEARRSRLEGRLLWRYPLPHDMGSRKIVEYRRDHAPSRRRRP